MNHKDVKVPFNLKKSETDASGNCPVTVRLIVGKHSETAEDVKHQLLDMASEPERKYLTSEELNMTMTVPLHDQILLHASADK